MTAGDKSEEGGDDVKSSCPLCLGLHTYYNGYNKEKRNSDMEHWTPCGEIEQDALCGELKRYLAANAPQYRYKCLMNIAEAVK